ncbi:MAG: aminomethyl-transferring glycine dehydrogenase subunit GcvPA, partial [Alphaproteobacteria bacterium]|nr:aminomethyl-transferring glycine dehydrogenase subunit GcvPA [Alphaproteobacteria bacterium]
AAQNMVAGEHPFFCGAGAYRHHVPASVDHIIQRSEFLTSYTPYQPEIAQGTLQYLFEFQSQICEITGMEVANASMYDGSTAAGEAVLMAMRIGKSRTRAVISGRLHPHYRAVIDTLAAMGGFTADTAHTHPNAPEDLAVMIDDNTSCVVVQNPDFFGNVVDYTDLATAAHEKGALFIVAVPEIVSLGVLKRPGDMGADIVVGEGQGLGNGLQFGGPYVGLFASRKKYLRQMPGRLCGQTQDSDGEDGFVLTLSTREQHIRRDKATSNICTNSGLCALAFTIHLTLLGGKGLQHLAQLNHARAVQLANACATIGGVEVMTDAFFNEISLRLPCAATVVVDALAEAKVLGGVPASRLLPEAALDDILIVAATETNSIEDIDIFVQTLRQILGEVVQ